MWPKNSFITITYDDAHLPPDGALKKTDLQKFLKRLRKQNTGKIIRFYACGEYGEKLGRPHYHLCLFNHAFDDQVFLTKSNGLPLYTSKKLDRAWGKGFASVGTMTVQSAAYVARYIMKKINGAAAPNHYEKIDRETGEIIWRPPEFTTMSRRPGIGAGWFEKYSGDVFPHDNVVHDGKKFSVPRYYSNIYEVENPREMEKIKARRVAGLEKHEKDLTPKRLAAREKCKNKQLDRLVRNLPNKEIKI